MTDDRHLPRRALPPASAEPPPESQARSGNAGAGGARPAGRRFAAADEPARPASRATPTSIAPTTPLGDTSTASVWSTPVPPPAKPSGRRFLGEATGDADGASAVRQPAASPTPSAEQTQQLPRTRSRQVPADGPEPPSPATTVLPALRRGAGTRAAGPPPTGIHQLRWFWPVVAAVAIAAIVVGFSLVNRGSILAAPTPTTTVRPVFLIEAADATAVAGGSWTATSDVTPDESTGMRCIQPSADLATPPLGGSVVRRTLTATTGSATIIQQQETYADDAAAAQAFTARSSQLGGCPATADLVTTGYTVSGLADEAVAVQVQEQDLEGVIHTLVLSRTGATVAITDYRNGVSAPPMDALATSLAPSLGRVCAAFGGTCPTTPTVQESAIPAGEPLGYLTSGDLPRVTVGVGSWVGGDVEPMKITGSGCEGVDLTKVRSAKSSAQRGYVLSDDPNASNHFGLDEIVYTFASNADAKQFSTSVMNSIKKCPARQATATVKQLGTLPSPATGQVFTVDQLVTLDKAARTRVLVASSGKVAVYIAANPTASFDLTDTQWLELTKRALTRAKQLPSR